MKCPELLSDILLSLLIFGPPLVVGYIIGRQDGKLSERKAILERWEEVDSIHRQDSIKQQRNNKAMKQKIQVTGKNIGDLFRLPCVYEIRKAYILPVPGDAVTSQSEKHIEVNARANESIYSDALTAHYGDWLVEDGNGNWHVESEEQH